jgi:acetoacetate decarboxylase
MPAVGGGAYPSPPYIYDTEETLVLAFDTDADAAAPLLPPGLELLLPARGVVTFVKQGRSPIGGYNEAWVGLRAAWKGEPLTFMIFCLLDNDIAMIAGREIWGIPKKLAEVTIEWHREIFVGKVERPAGVPICTVTAQLGDAVPEGNAIRPTAGACLRQIPSPEENGAPLVELIKMPVSQYHVTQGSTSPATWQAEAQLQFFSNSKQDPWGVLPVLGVRGARYTRGGGRHLGYGEVLHRYSG